MTRKIGFSKVSWLGVLAGLLGYFFHATMRSGGSAIPLVAFSVLMALLFWLSAVTLEKKSRYDEVFRPMRSDFICNTLGALVGSLSVTLADFLANKVPINPTALAIRNYIDMHLTESLSLDHLADTVSLSRSRLIHLFQEVYHVAPYQYYLSQKCKLAQSMLSRTTLPVSAISTQLGFLDPHHFSSFFKKQCGLSPASYRKLHTAPGNFPT